MKIVMMAMGLGVVVGILVVGMWWWVCWITVQRTKFVCPFCGVVEFVVSGEKCPKCGTFVDVE